MSIRDTNSDPLPDAPEKIQAADLAAAGLPRKPARPAKAGKRVPARPQPKGAAAAAIAPAPQSAETTKSTSQEEPEETSDKNARLGFFWYYLRHQAPSWLVSSITHAIVLITLALFTLGLPDDKDEQVVILSPSSEVVEDLEVLEEPDVILEELDQKLDQFKPEVVAEPIDPGAAKLGEVEAVAAVDVTDFGAGLLDNLDIGDLGADLGELEGTGKGALGDGIGMTEFFGVKTSGQRFMYVVDNSNSMHGGKFETACVELLKSVSKLGSRQSFYIIFYSDTAYPLFYPSSAPSWVKATPENKDRLRYWLKTVHRCLKTKGEEAMAHAFKMNPDIVYLLGDGAFTDKTLPRTLAFEDTRVVIHTLGFKMKPNDRAGFVQIAEKFKGKFHDVAVTPAMAELARQNNRPRNNKRNGVWGIKLGEFEKGGKRKKKKKK